MNKKIKLSLCVLMATQSLMAVTHANNTSADYVDSNVYYPLDDYNITHNITAKDLDIKNSTINGTKMTADSIKLDKTTSTEGSSFVGNNITISNGSNIKGSFTHNNSILNKIDKLSISNSNVTASGTTNVNALDLQAEAVFSGDLNIDYFSNSDGKLQGSKDKLLNLTITDAVPLNTLSNMDYVSFNYECDFGGCNIDASGKTISNSIFNLIKNGSRMNNINANNSTFNSKDFGVIEFISGNITNSVINIGFQNIISANTNNATINLNHATMIPNSQLIIQAGEHTNMKVNDNSQGEFIIQSMHMDPDSMDFKPNASPTKVQATITSNLNKLTSTIVFQFGPSSTIIKNKGEIELDIKTADGVSIKDVELDKFTLKENSDIKASNVVLSDGAINGKITATKANLDNMRVSTGLITANDITLSNSKSVNIHTINATLKDTEVGTAYIENISKDSQNVTFIGKLTTTNELNADIFNFKNDVEVAGGGIFNSSKDTGYKNVKANIINISDTTLINRVSNKLEANTINLSNTTSDYNASANIINIDKNSNINGNLDFSDTLNIDNSTIGGKITNQAGAKLLKITNDSIINAEIDTDTKFLGIGNKGNIFNASVSVGEFGDDNINNIFTKDFTSKGNAWADDNTFLDTLNVEDTLYASKSNTFADINAKNLNFTGTGLIELNNHDLRADGSAIIDGMEVNAYNFLMNNAEIKNTNTMAYLLGNKETPIKNPANIYKPTITSGTYILNDMSNKGGIRANAVNTANSHLVGQFATNDLVSNDTNYYLLGGGIDTTLYESFSGAVIARNSASGANNNIRINNTNILGLTKGLVPVAIVKESDITRANALSKDYFKLSYIRGTNTYSFNENMEHYKKFVTQDGKVYHAWLVGSTIHGDDMGELNEGNVEGVANGTDESFNAAIIANGNANAGTSPKDTNVNEVYEEIKNTTASDVILKYDEEVGLIFEGLDEEKGNAIDEIASLDEYIKNLVLNSSKQRLVGIKDLSHGLGFWYDAYAGKASTNLSDLKYKGLSFGIDKKFENSNNDLYFGLYANTMQVDVSKTIKASIDSKSAGFYTSAIYHNGLYLDFLAAITGAKSDVEESAFTTMSNKSNIFLASAAIGFKYGEKLYVEPSFGLNYAYMPSMKFKEDITEVTRFKKSLFSILPSFKVGYQNDKIDFYTSLTIEKDLSTSPYVEIEDDYVIVQRHGEKDFRLKTSAGIDYKASDFTNIKFDFTKDFYGNFNNDYRFNLGVRHSF
ncbi:autotransporter outer membrane beta-barrel domain-containing protein [Campylobacter sp. Cr9]|uniref:autotransporter outer membrane beta-barrel domain-containing protein n=1 Tax=Campylobacter sp. Cr9 TaxID=2735728 RepID=UPI0030154F5B|nr:autotransporter outer membrane beta-barrel domain-containing protein [Campylobacter sp. Cr9]